MERYSERGRAFITLIQQLYFKIRRINVIIDFHFMNQTTRKLKKKLDNSDERISEGGHRPKEVVTEM